MYVKAKKSITKTTCHLVLGALTLGAASLYATTASATYYYDDYPQWTPDWSMIHSHKIWDVNKNIKCFSAPENRCFLVVDFKHDYPYPFFLKMDRHFFYKGHDYPYYHRYYNMDEGPFFHTYYYYSYNH